MNEEITCNNCGNIPCHEARMRLERKGFALSVENVEEISGFRWRHVCARWIPVPDEEPSDV